jgi:glycosyltransferase involved in cell wall biosynthesis
MSFRRLAINGKYLGAGPTGVHRVADELIHQLVRRERDLADLFPQALCIVAPAHLPEQARFTVKMERRGVLSGQLWEQLSLPLLTRSDLLLNFCNLGPMMSAGAITMIHDAQVFITPGSYSRSFAAFYRQVLPILGRRHARILTVSEFTATQLVRFGVAEHDRISVIPNGGDHILRYEVSPGILERFQLKKRKFAVALANVQVHKNVGLLLKAFADPALNELRLVLVGDADRRQFEALGHSVPANVAFAGRVEDGELRGLLEAALCVAFPSTTEGFGLPPLEGMVLGCPAILAPCGALPEVGGKAALFASPDDPRQWVNAISRLASDHDAWEQCSRASRERAGLFTWNRAGEKLIDVIEMVASNESPR